MRTFAKLMQQYISSDFTLGILGGGQLGKMLLDVTQQWDINTHVLDPNTAAAAKNSCTLFVQGNLMDYDTVYAFGEQVDLLTIEIEHVNIDALYALEKKGVKVYPKPATLDVIQNKRTQKEFYEANQIPTAPFVAFNSRKELDEAVTLGKIKFPCIWKAARFGYDGFGVKKLQNAADIIPLPDNPCIVENLVPIDQEISVIVARNPSGEIALYPPVGMDFHPTANQVTYVYYPSNTSTLLAEKARSIAEELVSAWEHVGLLAVEFFVDKDQNIWVNEVAPRPHNSGHLTIEGCICSQFEQHLRAILDAPLGKTDFFRPAIMANIVGPKDVEGAFAYHGVAPLLQTPMLGLHIYGKKTTKPQRKMGHITLTGEKLEDIKSKISELKNTLQLKAN